MITEHPVLGLIRLDTFTNNTWEPWAASLNSLTLNRGGKRSGVTTTVEPGLLSATLINAGDPLRDTRLKPNVPVRIVTPYTTIGDFNALWAGKKVSDFNAVWSGKTIAQFNAVFVQPITIFTGVIHDLSTLYRLDKETGKTTTIVNLTATDAVTQHANQTRYGAVSAGGTGRESWAQRIIRLAGSSVTPVRVPADDSPITRYAI